MPGCRGKDTSRAFRPRSPRSSTSRRRSRAEFKDDYVARAPLPGARARREIESGEAPCFRGLTETALLAALKEVRAPRASPTRNAEDKYQALKRYGRELTDLARRGRLDPVIGRDEEIGASCRSHPP